MAVALPVVHMYVDDLYVDDSGTTRGDSFVVGMFCTTDDAGWRPVVASYPGTTSRESNGLKVTCDVTSGTDDDVT